MDKNLITFGSGENNDIKINSKALDSEQGYLEVNEFGIKVINTSNTSQMFGNNNKLLEDSYLTGGNFLKFINQEHPEIKGVVFLLSIGNGMDEWKKYTLHQGANTLGSSGECDIVLPPKGVAKRHATINKSGSRMNIYNDYSVNETYVNGYSVPQMEKADLIDLDVIIIGNSKMIVSDNKVYYQIKARGVRLDAIDIVKKVRIKFKVKEISSHVNMQIKPSEFVAFVGGSGAGKSTFLKCISGVNKPTSGTVLINGENLYENYESLKYNIGYVPQDDIVYSNLTLHDMLNYSAKLRMPDNTNKKERMERIKEVLNIVRFERFRKFVYKAIKWRAKKKSKYSSRVNS